MRYDMIKKIIIGLGIVITGLLITAAFKTEKMYISREITISAAPAKIFPYINNAKKSYEWMPWANGDTGIEINFSGPAEGLGASSSWNGKEMGVGSSEVIESIHNQTVRTKLTYTKPFEMNQTATGLLPKIRASQCRLC